MRKVALFTLLETMKVEDKSLLEDIKTEIEFKLFEIEMREPQSPYSDAHDRWEEKTDDLRYIVDDLEDLCENINDVTQEDINEIKESLEDYQESYKGLKNIKFIL